LIGNEFSACKSKKLQALPAFFYSITTYIRKEKSSRLCPEKYRRMKEEK
jgi:hypothetical protein